MHYCTVRLEQHYGIDLAAHKALAGLLEHLMAAGETFLDEDRRIVIYLSSDDEVTAAVDDK